ncbi:hypothetical protein PISL3812_05885 [Talaromyces islandicus]|uniref:Enoyl reductase (ER) domain-containing protein n=1 Tax=Talaromyces islandicus TaxID=28573 RepID=A0A0U1M1D3_TALIS|nr:hypothetical protein PISL3812_05885 [Talaromyces islandicus]
MINICETKAMQAVVYEGPFSISVKEQPKPVILAESDAILKVQVTGICGSDLHMYRGHQKTTTGHTMGHEFIGIVEDIGSEVSRFKVGQRVMPIFSPMCMNCWFCEHGYTNRCTNGPSFGSMALNVGQSEYVRVPYAESTLEAIPDEVSPEQMIIMCDIFPTGYYGAMKALMKLKNGRETAESIVGGTLYAPSVLQPSFKQQPLILGNGTVYAVDSVEDRLEEARKMGAIPLNLDTDDIPAIVKSVTGGRGADAVVESVGNQAALKLAFDVVRPCGVISSIGFHQSGFPFTGFEAYSKNIDINMGRAAVRPVFGEGLKVFAENQDKFADFITHRMPLAEAPKAYEIFEKRQARKVVLTL